MNHHRYRIAKAVFLDQWGRKKIEYDIVKHIFNGFKRIFRGLWVYGCFQYFQNEDQVFFIWNDEDQVKIKKEKEK